MTDFNPDRPAIEDAMTLSLMAQRMASRIQLGTIDGDWQPLIVGTLLRCAKKLEEQDAEIQRVHSTFSQDDVNLLHAHNDPFSGNGDRRLSELADRIAALVPRSA